MIIENLDSVIEKLHSLKALGVKLVIDDFGTGYSSLSYLHRLPIDSLKIDQSFIQAMHQDSAEIVTAIIGLAHNLGLDVVAEGIEIDAQREQLDRWGCDYGQGFLFARPQDSTDASALITPSAAAVAALGTGGLYAGSRLPAALHGASLVGAAMPLWQPGSPTGPLARLASLPRRRPRHPR